MENGDNSGVGIKVLMVTTIVVAITVLGGLNGYRIVCNKDADTIQCIESADDEIIEFETALVDNTEDSAIYSENIKFLATKTINLQDESSVLTDNDITDNGRKVNFVENVISRGNFLRGIWTNTFSQDVKNDGSDSNKLLDTVINEIRELGEIKDDIIEIVEAESEDTLTNVTEVKNDISYAAVTKIDKEEEVVAEPVKVEEVQTSPASGAPTDYVGKIDVKATAYCLCKKCCGKSPSNPGYGVTASGLKIVPGTGMKVVASDPSVIPLGTRVYVEGLNGAKDYGYAVVADTGSAIKNLKIDLYMDTHQMALNWGVKTVRVYILDN